MTLCSSVGRYLIFQRSLVASTFRIYAELHGITFYMMIDKIILFIMTNLYMKQPTDKTLSFSCLEGITQLECCLTCMHLIFSYRGILLFILTNFQKRNSYTVLVGRWYIEHLTCHTSVTSMLKTSLRYPAVLATDMWHLFPHPSQIITRSNSLF